MAVRPALPRRAGRRTNLALLGLLAAGLRHRACWPTASGRRPPATVVVAIHGAAGPRAAAPRPVEGRDRPPFVAARREHPRAGDLARRRSSLITVLTGVLHAIGVAPLSMLADPRRRRRLRGPAPGGPRLGTAPAPPPHRPLPPDRAARPAAWRRVPPRSGPPGEGVLRLTGAPGADRRGTGSLERGTDDPTAMPVTQWFTDTVPERTRRRDHRRRRRSARPGSRSATSTAATASAPSSTAPAAGTRRRTGPASASTGCSAR